MSCFFIQFFPVTCYTQSMPELILLSVGTASFGLVAMILMAMSWLQRRSTDLLSLIVFFAALWLMVLQIGIFHYTWQTNISMHGWPRSFSRGVSYTVPIMLAVTCVLFSFGNLQKKRGVAAWKGAFIVSLGMIAATLLLSLIPRAGDFRNAAVWACALWIPVLLAITVLTGRAGAKNADNRKKIRLAAGTAILFAAITAILHFMSADHSWAIVGLSLALSLMVFYFFFRHFRSTLSGTARAPDRSVPPAVSIPEAYCLTLRETEIARLIVAGKTNGEIAAALFISPKTVESHLSNIFRKMKVSSRVQVVSQILSRVSGKTPVSD